jgi:hypothetical protein
MLKTIKIIIIFSVIFYPLSAYGFSFPNYGGYNSTFYKLSKRVLQTWQPYNYTAGAYSYIALPIETTLSNCKIISVVRKTAGFYQRKYWVIVNYKFCGNALTEKHQSFITNPPGFLIPFIKQVVAETKQYGNAKSNYDGYRIIGKAGVDLKSVYLIILYHIRLISILHYH